MDILSVGTNISIVIICYLIGIGLKALDNVPNKWIPVIVGAVGGVLGLICYFMMPEFATDPMLAIAIGIVSGLSSTGINQIYKQSQKEE